MRKAQIAIWALLAVAFPAVAETGVVTGTGFGEDQGAACIKAQDDARAEAVLDGMRFGKSNAHVVSFSACQCTPPDPPPRDKASLGWRCTVQANYSTD